MKSYLTTFLIIFFLLFGFASGYLTRKTFEINPYVLTDTDTLYITKVDTIKVKEFKTITKNIVRHDTLLVARTDTIHKQDTILVPIKSYQTTIPNKGIIYHSGYNSHIDSVHLATHTTTRTIYKMPRLTIGISTGVGISTKGTVPYIGVGVNYNLIRIK